MNEELLPYDSKRLSSKALDEMIRAAKEKAGIAVKRQPHHVRPVVLILSVTVALLVSAVSAGAILYWDIFGIFKAGHDTAQITAAERSEELSEMKKEFLGKINVPENAAAFPEYTKREYKILTSLAFSTDITFDYGDRVLNISGYVFDGSCIDVIYDVTYKDCTVDEATGTEFIFSCEESQTAVFSHFYQTAAEANTVYCRSRSYLDLPDGIDSFDILVSMDGDDPEEIPPERFTVAMPEDVQTIRLSERKVFENENGDVYLIKFILSPLGAFMEVSESVGYLSSFDHNAYPIYVTYNDGITVDLSDYTGNFEGGAAYMTEDGRAVIDYIIGQNMNIFDTKRISSVQIFNEVIKFD